MNSESEQLKAARKLALELDEYLTQETLDNTDEEELYEWLRDVYGYTWDPYSKEWDCVPPTWVDL